MTAWLVRARKFIAALAGAASEAVSVGLLTGTPEKWVTGCIGVATAFIVYVVENEAPPAVVVADVPAPAVVVAPDAALSPVPPTQPEAPFSGGH